MIGGDTTMERILGRFQLILLLNVSCYAQCVVFTCFIIQDFYDYISVIKLNEYSSGEAVRKSKTRSPGAISTEHSASELRVIGSRN